MSVNLDYHPDTRALLSGQSEDAFEIPTTPSDIQNLKDELRQLDLPAIGLKAEQVLVSMRHVFDELNVDRTSLDGLNATLATTKVAVRELDTSAVRAMADFDRLAMRAAIKSRPTVKISPYCFRLRSEPRVRQIH